MEVNDIAGRGNSTIVCANETIIPFVCLVQMAFGVLNFIVVTLRFFIVGSGDLG